MNHLLVAATVAVVALAGPAVAAGETGGIEPYAGARVSTLGVGAEIGARFYKSFGLRLNGQAFNYSQDFEVDDISYAGDLKLRSAGLVLDFHPLETGFFISAGAYWNGNTADVTATPTGSVTIGGTTYTAADAGTVSGSVEANSIAPYVGLGYSGAITGGFELGVEAGVLYTGEYKVDLRSDSPIVSQADLNAERDRIEDEIGGLSFWPVVAIRGIYRF